MKLSTSLTTNQSFTPRILAREYIATPCEEHPQKLKVVGTVKKTTPKTLSGEAVEVTITSAQEELDRIPQSPDWGK